MLAISSVVLFAICHTRDRPTVLSPHKNSFAGTPVFLGAPFRVNPNPLSADQCYSFALATFALRLSPFGDFSVVAVQQHFWDLQAAELFRTSVLRVFYARIIVLE